MNMITYGLKYIKDTIPNEILELALKEKTDWRVKTITTLDERILSSMIVSRVLVDCNIVGGTEIEIPLEKCTIKHGDEYSTVINVPKILTKGLNIISAKSIYNKVPLETGSTENVSGGDNAITSALTDVYNSSTGVNILTTARLELVGSNTIFIDEDITGYTNAVLKVDIENSNNLSNVSPKATIKFGLLCEKAARAYIYKNLVIKLDKGSLYGGHELGVIKDIVTEYSTGNDEYIEYLTNTWKKVAYLSDTKKTASYISGMFSGQ